jgi:hypothetical protein
MEWFKRNPGGWVLALGGAIGFVSILFSWMSITNTAANVSSSLPAFRAVSGQTLGLLSLLVILTGLGVAASQGSGRILYGLIGLLFSGIMLAAGLVAIFSPSTIAQLFATTETMSKLAITSVQESIDESIKAGFADGTLTASVGFGAILGVIGGLLGVIGAILGFRKKRPAVD